MSEEARPDVSIIVVNRNTRDLLAACLGSLRDTARPLDIETIVVDNASTDGSVAAVEEHFPEVRLIRNATNTGFAYPNNQGLAVSHGRYVMLLNSDTIVRPGALARLVRFMDDRPDAGACGPRLVYPDGRLQRSCASFETPWRWFCDMLDLGKLFPRSPAFGNLRTLFDHAVTAPVDWVMGAALLVRREVVHSVGVLDEQFRIHCNESDWCYRMHLAGWKVYYVHDAEVVHYCGETRRREVDRSALEAEMARNLIDYYRKHHGRLGVASFRLWGVAGFALRRVKYAVVNTLRPSERSLALGDFCRGMFRVAWTGDPNKFGARARR
jgi:GT2 family glycosyltransferase